VHNTEDEALLGEICKQHGVQPVLLNKLLELEIELIGMGRRHGLYEKIGEILERAVSTGHGTEL
jgi:hypothetical protein